MKEGEAKGCGENSVKLSFFFPFQQIKKKETESKRSNAIHAKEYNNIARLPPAVLYTNIYQTTKMDKRMSEVLLFLLLL